jgi:hypothetical protein
MTTQTPFTAALISRLENSETPKVVDIELGEGDTLLHAQLPNTRGMYGQPSRLLIGCHRGMLVVCVRNLGVLSSPLTNAVVATITSDLVEILTDKAQLTLQSRLAHVMATETFLSRRKSIFDLLAHIVSYSNNLIAGSRAVVDFRDGEVYLDSFIDCDFETIPASFDHRLGLVATHAAMLSDMLRFVRANLSEAGATFGEADRRLEQFLSEAKQRYDKAATEGEDITL